METVTTVREARDRIAAARRHGRAVELVPTMGSFHEGHLALMRQARAAGGYLVVSLFVNPTQFGKGEDFTVYPRDLERDQQLAAAEGAELIFAPSTAEMYPPGFQTAVEVVGLSQPLCGRSRPGHFRGVATVVTKLFQIVHPDRAYFGEKDFQQLRLVEQLVTDLNMPLNIVPVPTVREADGLAMSSRNALLSPKDRLAARAVPEAWQAALAEYRAGERRAAALVAAARRRLEAERGCQVDYVEVVDRETLAPVQLIDRPAQLALAARFGGVRLIDNARLGEE
jgi:pantoate--beta-alanine ligase